MVEQTFGYIGGCVQSWRRELLGTMAQIIVMRPNTLTTTGWSVAIPAFEAIAPAIEGTRADPAWPDPAIQPTAPVRSQRGNTLPQWFIAIGYIGPINIPMLAIATASPTRDGMNHIMNSSPMAHRA